MPTKTPAKKARKRSVKVDVKEASIFREALEKAGQLQEEDRELGPGMTHVRKKKPDGEEVLVRRRFSAVSPKR